MRILRPPGNALEETLVASTLTRRREADIRVRSLTGVDWKTGFADLRERSRRKIF